MKVIDAHMHIYERINGYGNRGELRPIGNGEARWANGDVVRLIPKGLGDTGFLTERLIAMLDQNKVEKAVVLQGNLYGFQNEYICQSVKRFPDRIIGACTVDPFGRDAEKTLAYLLDRCGFTAVKFEMSDNCGLMGFHKKFAINGEIMEPLYRIIARRGATLVFDIGSKGMDSYQPGAVMDIAKRYPETKIVICHLMAHKPGEHNLLRASLEKMKLDNIWFDLAALPWNTAPEPYPYKTALEYIRIAKEVVGHKKLIWGSDAPAVMLTESYSNLCDYLRNDASMTNGELQDIYYNNALDAYQFRS